MPVRAGERELYTTDNRNTETNFDSNTYIKTWRFIMKGIIFDMDGTLVSSMPFWNKCYEKVIKGRCSYYPDDLVEILTPLGINKGAEYIHNLGHEKSSQEIYDEIQDIMTYEYINNIPLKPYAMEYIKSMYDQGIKMCVLSASTQKMINACIESKGVMDYIEFAIASETLNMAKSQPEIFKIIADKMGLRVEEIMVIDDSIYVLEAAKKAGATACGIYDDEWKDMVDSVKNTADKYVYSFEELL